MGQVTQLLIEARAGNVGSRDALFALVYDELMRLARQRLSRGTVPTLLDAPALVHEVYLHLTDRGALTGNDRNQFFAYASTAMRNVVCDFARERKRKKRGGGAQRVTLTTGFADDGREQQTDIEDLSDALEQLGRVDARLHRVVEMRYFGGLSLEEVAQIEGSSLATVKRDWTKARAFLFDALSP